MKSVDLKDEIRGATIDKLICLWSEPVPASVESTVRFRIDVANALRAKPEGIRFLKDQLRSESLEKRFRALNDLARKEVIDDEIMSFLLETFAADEPYMKLCALSHLRKLKYFALDQNEMERLFSNQDLLDGEMASEAMLYLVDTNPDLATTILRRGLTSDNKNIRGNACFGAFETKNFELLPELELLVDDPEWYVATCAMNAVDWLRTFPPKRKVNAE